MDNSKNNSRLHLLRADCDCMGSLALVQNLQGCLIGVLFNLSGRE